MGLNSQVLRFQSSQKTEENHNLSLRGVKLQDKGKMMSPLISDTPRLLGQRRDLGNSFHINGYAISHRTGS
ncbi:hypothetical protein TcWFU_006367 [Taenia crassiceps]|uniref:Uncharacterized protein n=1 Tax=Taenia crassiceps TaxID=6207 RepID=A0ABR4QRI8_9CEST